MKRIRHGCVDQPRASAVLKVTADISYVRLIINCAYRCLDGLRIVPFCICHLLTAQQKMNLQAYESRLHIALALASNCIKKLFGAEPFEVLS